MAGKLVLHVWQVKSLLMACYKLRFVVVLNRRHIRLRNIGLCSKVNGNPGKKIFILLFCAVFKL